ncbi:hypothetical protein FRC06_010291 [Ceratobasidium sp. 370]|nr:hypothetical protein FRC06_010291 [Ceratobasidium sp. 370]
MPKAGKQSKPPAFGEHFMIMQTSCNHARLYIAVFHEGFETLDIGSTSIVRQEFDQSLGAFPLDMSSRVCKPVVKLTQDCSNANIAPSHTFFPLDQIGKEALRAAQITGTSTEVCG